ATYKIYTIALHDALPIFYDFHFMKRKSKHQKSGKEAPKMSRKLSEEAPNSAYDCMRRVDTTRRHNWTIWRANYEERRRIEREYADRKSTRLNSSHVKISY